MKNVTKANVLFSSTVLVYIILVYAVRIIAAESLPVNVLLVMPEIFLLIPSLVYMLVLKPDAADGAGLAAVSVGTFFKTVLLTFLIMPLIWLVNLISSFFVGNSVNTTLETIVNENPLWLNLIIVALIPAVVEEFIFRGLIFNGYKRRNPVVAVFLSAFLFGLIHMNINQMSYAFVIGVIFALLAYATGSLIPSITAHFIINGISVVFSHIAASQSADGAVNAENQLVLNQTLLYVMTFAILFGMMAAGLVLGALVFFSICKKNRGLENVKNIFRKPYRRSYNESEGKYLDGYLMLGVGICLIYVILYDFVF